MGHPITIGFSFRHIAQNFLADIDLARKLILQAMNSIEDVLPEPSPDTLIVELDESTANLRARWWTHSYRKEVITVQDRVIDAIKRRLDENGIDMTYPTRTVLLHQAAKN